MSLFFKNNDFKTGYKQRPFDSYKSVVNKLDEETKKKLDQQRTIGMVLVVAFVFILIVILAVTGIGIDKTKSVTGVVFADKEQVLIECFGDSITEGYTLVKGDDGEHAGISQVTYPAAFATELTKLLKEDDHTYKCTTPEVKNYGISGSVIKAQSDARLSGNADIVLMLYSANNFMYHEEYEGTLEANIDSIRQKGAAVFLLNYPTPPDSPYEVIHQQANNYIANTAESMSVPLIDICSYMNSLTDYTQEELFCSDGAHLTATGYQLMGEYAAKVIHQYYYDLY